MKDLKYIIKRIIIGTGIVLAVMFMKQNVFAYEWTTEGDEQISTSQKYLGVNFYYNNSYINNSNPSYPWTATGNNTTQGFYSGNESGYAGGTRYISSSKGDYFFTGLVVDLGTLVFEPNLNYYVVVPLGYNSSDLLSYNNDKLLDSSIYTSNSNYVTITNASFSVGSPNDVESSSTYNSLIYFKIFFNVSQELTDLDLYINFNPALSSNRQSITYTAYKTTTFNNYLFKFGNGCTSISCSPSTYYSNRFYKPFLYTWAGSIIPAPADGNDIASDVSSDIKTQIQDIIDGQFTDDLNFPYLNGGGRTFGDNTYTLQDLLIMPLNFVQKLTSSDTCSPLTVPVPGLNATMQLPCLSTFASSMLGQQIVDMIKLIVGCILGFKILTALYNSILHIFDPQHLLWVDDIF